MDKKGNLKELFSDFQKLWKSFKQSYLYKMVSRFLSTVCSIILVILLIIGALMFYFNMKMKSYASRGLEYNAPFGLYTIITGSMEPNVEVYDVVIAVEEDTSKIKIGDVITFISTWDINSGVTVTHRVIGISKTATGEVQLTTKGDNNPTPDGAPVTQSNLIGKVVGRLPQLGKLQFFLATKMGWFFVVFIPAVIIIIMDGIKIFKLYVLKGKIDNVKSPKEAIQSDHQNEVVVPKVSLSKVLKDDAPKKKIPDENIDTVELPKVGEDGIIKENTSELPIINAENRASGDEEVAILSIPLNDEKVQKGDSAVRGDVQSELPIIKKDSEVDLPSLKSSNEDSDEDRVPLPKRSTLKRRD